VGRCAGPAANLVMALGWALADLKPRKASGKALFSLPNDADGPKRESPSTSSHGAELLPILPLDGRANPVSLLPDRLALRYARLEPFGFPILLVLIFLPPQSRHDQ